ncbi:hypothetical protein [Pseudomonas retamae]|uniref:Uncharacterized protein n=1 Tax=Pseudomonas retamae TaxID=702110 RepID=A0ABW7DHG4_9PSED
MSNKPSKTEGRLTAAGTSVSGFSTDDVSAQRHLSDNGYTFEGVSTTGERLVFFIRTLEITTGKSFPIEQYGDTGTAAALFKDDKNLTYNGRTGEVNFEHFDIESEKVKISADFVMFNNSAQKHVIAEGDFSGIVQNNKSVLDKEGNLNLN